MTDGTGQYKIIELRPGVYTVSFKLPGFTSMQREGIEVTISGGKENLAPRKVLATPWWILFDTDRPLWFGFTGATGGLRSTIDILNLSITPQQ